MLQRTIHRRRVCAAIIAAALLLAFCPSLPMARAAVSPQSAETQNHAPVLRAKFEGVLNTKSAKPGDSVEAKTVSTLKLADLEIPKGSKLVGTVASVKSKDSGNGTSTLAIKFDHVELKDGAILRIQGLIVAIGVVSSSDGLGANSVLARGGAGSDAGLDPNMEIGHAANPDDIPAGSSMQGVALAVQFDSAGATELRGTHRDIRLDSDVMVKVALFRGSAS